VDGAAMPGPVGANPSLTIAAFAERTCAHIIESADKARHRGISPSDAVTDQAEAAGAVVDVGKLAPRALAPDATKGKAAQPEQPASAVASAPALAAPGTRGLGLPAKSTPEATSVRFTEQMHGWFSPGVTDPEKGRSLGRDRSRRIMFELTITAEDIDRFAADPKHPATAEGYVLADYFGGRMPVERGWFNLFVADVSDDGRPARRMLYRLWLRDPGGTPFTFTGHKLIHNEAGFDLWPDTTTLYATIARGHVPPPESDAPPDVEPVTARQEGAVGAGILFIRPLDFARQLTTFRAEGPAPAAGLLTFGKLFGGELWQVYGRAPRRVPFPFKPKQ